MALLLSEVSHCLLERGKLTWVQWVTDFDVAQERVKRGCICLEVFDHCSWSLQRHTIDGGIALSSLPGTTRLVVVNKAMTLLFD